MTASLADILPKEMTVLKSRPLFALLLDVQPACVIGATPGVDRRVGVITGGRFEGERMRGTVLSGGSDWQSVRPGDGAWTLDVRVVLKTEDDALIGMTYRGIRKGPQAVLDRIARGEAVNPSEYYLRASPFFETSAPRYAWLNDIVAIASGHRLKEGPVYQVFEIL